MDKNQEIAIVGGEQYVKFHQQKLALDGLKELASMYVEAEMVPDSYFHKPKSGVSRWKLEGEALEAYNKKISLKVALAFAKGSEFGWSPQTCLEWIYIVGGKTSVYGAGVMSLIQQHPEYVDFHYKHFFDDDGKWEKTVGYVKTKKSGDKYHEVEYTRKMAIQANLFPTKVSEGLPMVVKYKKDYNTKKMVPYLEYNNWCKHPYDMAYHKMIARVQKAYFPLGVEVYEDLEDDHFGEVVRMNAPAPSVAEPSSINKVRDVEPENVISDEDAIKEIGTYTDHTKLTEYLQTIKSVAPGAYEYGLGILNKMALEKEQGSVETLEEAEQMMDAAQPEEKQEDPVKEESAPEATEEEKVEEKQEDPEPTPEPEEKPAKNFVNSVSKWMANEDYTDMMTEEEVAKYEKLVKSGFVSQEDQAELKALLKSASDFKKILEATQPGMSRVKISALPEYAKYSEINLFKKITFAKNA